MAVNYIIIHVVGRPERYGRYRVHLSPDGLIQPFTMTQQVVTLQREFFLILSNAE